MLLSIILASFAGLCFTILVLLVLFLGLVVSMQYNSSEPTNKSRNLYKDDSYKEDEYTDDYPDDNW